MAIEIERKFLIQALPADLDRHPSNPIAQGYLASSPEGATVRLRRKGEKCFLTIKGSGGRSRTEVELPLAQADFDALWPLTEGHRLQKKRHEIPLDNGLTIELDVFEDSLAGLVMAEVEFPGEKAAQAFQPPPWFGREVTEDFAYSNSSLAKLGRPPES
jgi:adenylate cyclase